MNPGSTGGYDHVIIGAGLSGVLLAHHLLAHGPAIASSAGGPRILLVDPDLRDGRRATLAFWAARTTMLDRWALRSWDQLLVVGHDDRSERVDLGDWRYTAIPWGTARAELLTEILADPRVTGIEARVQAVRDVHGAAEVLVDGRWIRGAWVYDSRPHPAESVAPRGGRAIRLFQTFRGVWVSCEEPRVDCGAATLLDFSADEGADLGFAYVLPVTEHSVMVMAVRMGQDATLPDPLPAVPRELGGAGWQVVAEEAGVTPLVVPAPPRREGRRVLAIGRRGGRVRPSTGYALMRILADSQAIVASLRRHGHPFAVPPDPWSDRVLDAVWLRALARERASLEPAFHALFAKVRVGSVLRFLDGCAGPADVARVVAALPPGPFVRAAADLALGRPAGPADLSPRSPR